MSKKRENTAFICEQCGATVKPVTNGSYRNHCPYCLYSKHLDDKPGDRKSACQGLMMPIDIVYNPKKGYQIVHQCVSCGHIRRNLVATNTIQDDHIFTFLNSRKTHTKQ
ncbi:RNHCP domain-containing protein [Evansella caseinilytica]|uniref:RNHCP domain-containing protein n=1 Tax=Evansella caseinilytica TaxID=1503961 RepID=A0A1H3USD8_9BACI|nr:RNHCP domain-containing protein [Evansella caseinilytica]SDZ64699.1 RNHCP domain-containing protein [Evansella caseinilytica]